MKNVLICGLGKSGVSSAKLLLRQEDRVFLFDKGDFDKEQVKSLTDDGAILLDDLTDDLINKLNLVVLSPGISIYDEIIENLAKKTKVIGELELGFQNCKAMTVAVTGTNGKTTTSTLIDYILNKGGKNSYLLGNVGTAFTSIAADLTENDICVVETSSFQLETVDTYKPHIACLLNLSPDHLDRHGSFACYADTKFKIFQNQTKQDFAVLNADDKTIVSGAKKIKSNITWFSAHKKTNGAYCKDGWLCFKDEKIAEVSKTSLLGEHNLQNMLCAVAVCKILGLNNEDIREGLYTFQPIKHRLQKVGSIGEVDFINDSKATNVASVLPALGIFDSVSLILGGSDKNCAFDDLFKAMPKTVKYCVFTGETQNKLAEAARKYNFTKFFFANDFSSAVRIAYQSIRPKGTVLLSPACASFDEFENFEQRGEQFVKVYDGLKNEQAKV